MIAGPSTSALAADRMIWCMCSAARLTAAPCNVKGLLKMPGAGKSGAPRFCRVSHSESYASRAVSSPSPDGAARGTLCTTSSRPSRCIAPNTCDTEHGALEAACPSRTCNTETHPAQTPVASESSNALIPSIADMLFCVYSLFCVQEIVFVVFYGFTELEIPLLIFKVYPFGSLD